MPALHARAALLSVLTLALALATKAQGEREKAGRTETLDRTRAVGAPVLDGTSADGVFVWIEDGWIHLAGASKQAAESETTVVYTVKISSTHSIRELELGDIQASRPRQGAFVATLTVRGVPVQGKFKTDGDVSIFSAMVLGEKNHGDKKSGSKKPARILVGPLAKPVASGVTINRAGRRAVN